MERLPKKRRQRGIVPIQKRVEAIPSWDDEGGVFTQSEDQGSRSLDRKRSSQMGNFFLFFFCCGSYFGFSSYFFLFALLSMVFFLYFSAVPSPSFEFGDVDSDFDDVPASQTSVRASQATVWAAGPSSSPKRVQLTG